MNERNSLSKVVVVNICAFLNNNVTVYKCLDFGNRIMSITHN